MTQRNICVNFCLEGDKMLTKNSLEKIINNLIKEKYLNEFINLTFNYSLKKNDSINISIQSIDNDIILSIYQMGTINKIEFYHFVLNRFNNTPQISNKDYIVINYIFVKKCILQYINKKNTDNLSKFVASFSLTNKKKILLEYLPQYIVDVIIGSL